LAGRRLDSVLLTLEGLRKSGKEGVEGDVVVLAVLNEGVVGVTTTRKEQSVYVVREGRGSDAKSAQLNRLLLLELVGELAGVELS
jgi:hypothetical protein